MNELREKPLTGDDFDKIYLRIVLIEEIPDLAS